MEIDVTERYIDMIHAFECDFSLASDRLCPFELSELQEQLYEESNSKLLDDIKLLEELSFDLRHNNLRIVTVK